MSHTFYHSPDGIHPSISIDVTHGTAWFFQHTDEDGRELDPLSVVICAKEQLPLIAKALTEYLGAA